MSGARAETYTYDSGGNRTMTCYATTTGNELTAGGGYTYTYDNAGNQTGKTLIANGNVWTYAWDDRNRLTGVVEHNSGGTVLMQGTYTYDTMNRRIGVDETVGGVETKTWTVYDGVNPYADFNGSGVLQERYLYGPAVDEVLARTNSGGTTAWYLADKLGSIRDVANVSGTVIDHVAYDAYGNVKSETSPTNGDKFKFDGMQYDAALGSYDDNRRWYDPITGRFLSPDPSGFTAGDPDLYRYVGNGPTNATDPTGLDGVPASQQAGGPMPTYRQFNPSGEFDPTAYANFAKATAAWQQQQYAAMSKDAPIPPGNNGIGPAYDFSREEFELATDTAAVQGLAQGGLNALQAVFNIPAALGNASNWVLDHIFNTESGQWVPYDISTGVITSETPYDHNLSVAAGGFGLTTLAGVGLGGAAFGAAGGVGGGIGGGAEGATISLAAPAVGMGAVAVPLIQSGLAVGAGIGIGQYFAMMTGSGKEGAQPGKGNNPGDYLDQALAQQGLAEVPAGGFKQKWSEGGYDYEVRVHPAEPTYGKQGNIYRVGRRSQTVDANGQGTGWEYLDSNGQWHVESTLKPGKPGYPNPNYNDQAAQDTHLQL